MKVGKRGVDFGVGSLVIMRKRGQARRFGSKSIGGMRRV